MPDNLKGNREAWRNYRKRKSAWKEFPEGTLESEFCRASSSNSSKVEVSFPLREEGVLCSASILMGTTSQEENGSRKKGGVWHKEKEH